MDNEFKIRENKLIQLQSWHKAGEIPLIINLTKDGDPVVRAEALMILGKLGNKELYGHIVSRLTDSDHHVRFCAAEALGNLGSEYAVEPLIETAINNSEFVRCRAINALGKIHCEKALNFLIEMMLDSSESVSEESAVALESMLDLPLCQEKLFEFFDNDFLRQKKFKQLFKMLNVQLKMKNVFN